jgi:hypothetical protein
VNDLGSKEIVLSAPKNSKTFVVSVMSQDPKCTYSLKAVGRSGNNNKNNNNNNNNNNDEVCDNCKKHIPVSSMQLHQVRCRKLVFFCELCNAPMNVNAQEKHITVMHAEVMCPHCGDPILRFQLPLHRKETCRMRNVKCIYCAVKILDSERGEHQGLCGHKRAQCQHCDLQGKRNEMARHCEMRHGIYLPKANQDWFID